MSKRYRDFDYGLLREFDIFYYAPECRHDLVSGVPFFPAVQELVSEAVREHSAHSSGYSRAAGEASFRAAVLQSLAIEDVQGRAVMATAGCTGGLLIAMLTLLEADDEVLIFDPDYAAYAYLARLVGASPRVCPRGPDFRIGVDEVAKRMGPKTKMIALSNPSNPLGLVVSADTLRRIIQIAAERGAWVVCDEVYADFAQGTNFVCAAALGENTLSIRSFSKSAGLAGWRIGYCIAAEEVMSRMLDVQEWSLICAPVIAQHIGTAILLRKALGTADFVERRRTVCAMLRAAGVRFVEPEAGFFVYVEAPNGSGAQFAKICLQHGIAILPGTMFSERDTHVRLSFAGDWLRTVDAVNAFTKLYQDIGI